MLKIDLLSKKSIYEQVTDGIKQMILSGEYKPGDKIVSVRELSTQLTVNPNTVQKAFKALESEGYIHTVTGKGSFVSESKKGASAEEAAQLFGRLDSVCREIIFAGIEKEEIILHIQNEIEGKGEK